MAEVVLIEKPESKIEELLEVEKAVEVGEPIPRFLKDRTIYRCRTCQKEFQLKPSPHAARLVKCPEKACKSTDIEIVRA